MYSNNKKNQATTTATNKNKKNLKKTINEIQNIYLRISPL